MTTNFHVNQWSRKVQRMPRNTNPGSTILRNLLSRRRHPASQNPRPGLFSHHRRGEPFENFPSTNRRSASPPMFALLLNYTLIKCPQNPPPCRVSLNVAPPSPMPNTKCQIPNAPRRSQFFPTSTATNLYREALSIAFQLLTPAVLAQSIIPSRQRL